jgi:hypothetical protein
MEYDDYNNKTSVRAAFYISVFYAGLMGIFLFVHTSDFMRGEKLATTAEIENSYKTSNQVPIVTGLLELTFPLMHDGDLWFLPYFGWLISAIVTGITIYLISVLGNQLNTTAVATLLTAAFLLYQITSDFSEYWVQTRIKSADDDPDEDDSDEEDGSSSGSEDGSEEETEEEKEKRLEEERKEMLKDYRRKLRKEDDAIRMLEQGTIDAKEEYLAAEDPEVRKQLHEHFSQLAKLHHDVLQKRLMEKD